MTQRDIRHGIESARSQAGKLVVSLHKLYGNEDKNGQKKRLDFVHNGRHARTYYRWGR